MLLVVPGPDEEYWPTLGPQICDLIEERAVYGPGSLQGQAYEIDPEFRAFLYRAFEVYPKGHPWEGRRRFKRVGLSVRKGLAKTEKMSLVAFCELHPEGPTRFDGWDASGNPVGRPVRSPYIPMLAVTVEQVEELAFGALTYIIENGPDADLFDVSQERIVRLDEYGRADGKAVPLANSPGSRDGARTTLNCFDEPHRLYLPRQLEAHQTMDANLPKRPLDDPWSLYVGTAGELGQGSVAEQVHTEAEAIRDGKIERPDLFYLYRSDDGGHDLTVKAERIVAVSEATGPAGEFGPGQFDEIASKWDRPGADTSYLERVWLNRWVRSGQQAFDTKRWRELARVGGHDDGAARTRIPRGAKVVVGFDGARRRDSTAFVVTELATGTQELAAIWERDLDVEDWEVPEGEVNQKVDELFDQYEVWRMYCDPPYWVTEVGTWAGEHKGRVEEWWTNRYKTTAYAIRAFQEAIASGAVGWTADDPLHEDFGRHIANAGQAKTNFVDDNGDPMFILGKIHPDRKFDAAMAALLSWQGYLDAVKAGENVQRAAVRPRRLR
ncbi:hypothetical protein [Isoptericola sp. NPDC055881]